MNTDNPDEATTSDSPKGELIVYQTEGGRIQIDVRLEQETVWLSQEHMARLFGKTKQTIWEHIRNIFKEGELDDKVVVRKFLTTTPHGAMPGKTQVREVIFYNLDVVIAVGYRVRSPQGTRFRIWATERLKEYLVKGFTMDDKRLKEPDMVRYFEELLARIRDIRSSEKVFWRKVLDIYATSVDYDPNAETSRMFFKQVQNKMHWAAHGHTAAELIQLRANAKLPNMGITNYPGNTLLMRDVEIAKNYLSDDELDMLNRIVTAYLEVAEIQARSRKIMTMQDWIERLDGFLTMSGRELLTHAGSVSHEAAMEKAHLEYEKFHERQLLEPSAADYDFMEAEQAMKKLKSGKSKPRGESD